MATREDLEKLLWCSTGLPFEFEEKTYDNVEDMPHIDGFYITEFTSTPIHQICVWGKADGTNEEYAKGETYGTTLDKLTDEQISYLHHEVYTYMFGDEDYEEKFGEYE